VQAVVEVCGRPWWNHRVAGPLQVHLVELLLHRLMLALAHLRGRVTQRRLVPVVLLDAPGRWWLEVLLLCGCTRVLGYCRRPLLCLWAWGLLHAVSRVLDVALRLASWATVTHVLRLIDRASWSSSRLLLRHSSLLHLSAWLSGVLLCRTACAHLDPDLLDHKG